MIDLNIPIIFILGLLLGSFYNVVGLRIPKKQSIIYPHSHCVTCKRELRPFELIPVFSYLFLRGKCSKCKTKFSSIYMWMELMTGLLFAFSYVKLGFTPELAVAWLFISLFIIITVSDLTYMLIPNKILLCFLPLLLIARIVSPLDVWWDSFVGAVVGFSILLLIAILSKGGMGGGDIKLFFLIGIVLGTVQTIVTLMLAAVIGLIVGLIVLKGLKKDRKTPIPFGPSIACAAMIMYFYGEEMITAYMNLSHINGH